MAQCIEVAAKYEKWFMWLVSLPGALALLPRCPRKPVYKSLLIWLLPAPAPVPALTLLPPLSLHPQLAVIPTAAWVSERNGSVGLFVCLGHALIELWGFSLRSLQLFYVNYSLQPGVSFSWLSCTFLVSCFLDSRFCFFRPLSALNQVELTASLAQALDNINLYLDLTCLLHSPTQYHLFVRVSCLAFAFNFQLPHKYECYKSRIISRISFPTAEAPQQINRLGASASAPACSTFVYLWLGAPCPCCSALLWSRGFWASISCPSLWSV